MGGAMGVLSAVLGVLGGSVGDLKEKLSPPHKLYLKTKPHKPPLKEPSPKIPP